MPRALPGASACFKSSTPCSTGAWGPGCQRPGVQATRSQHMAQLRDDACACTRQPPPAEPCPRCCPFFLLNLRPDLPIFPTCQSIAWGVAAPQRMGTPLLCCLLPAKPSMHAALPALLSGSAKGTAPKPVFAHFIRQPPASPTLHLPPVGCSTNQNFRQPSSISPHWACHFHRATLFQLTYNSYYICACMASKLNSLAVLGCQGILRPHPCFSQSSCRALPPAHLRTNTHSHQ